MVGVLRCQVGLKRWVGRGTIQGLLTLAVVLLCFTTGRAQRSPGPEPASAASAATAQNATPAAQSEATHSPLTKNQAKDLLNRVDKILSFVSTDTGLPIVHSVKRKLITRDEVNKYLSQKFEEDAGAKRLAREEIVLKKFGLLDRDFHLRPFMISLLT
jgi:hypothetical protein